MWQVLVRLRNETSWLLISSFAGPGAEADGRARFERVRALLAGERADERNRHANDWYAARLVQDETVVEECEHDDDLSTWPAPRNDRR